MPMVELRGLSALEAWSRKVTTGYKDVKVRDLSTSWRDGLAFCALIHHFRPDLIDFDSLSKENILYNNRLAFAIAEKHLGVPSLLDAEDMFKHEEPDRLSVATYLSQFYECFEGSKSDRKQSISGTNSRNSVTFDENKTNLDMNNKRNSLTHPPIPPKRDMRCQLCKLRVYILERIIIDDKVYHKSCFDSLNTEEIAIENEPQINRELSVESNNSSIDLKINGCQQLDINDIKLEVSDSVVNNDLSHKTSDKLTDNECVDYKTDAKLFGSVSDNSINDKIEDKSVINVNEELINEKQEKIVVEVNDVLISEKIDTNNDKNANEANEILISDKRDKNEDKIVDEVNDVIINDTNVAQIDSKEQKSNTSIQIKAENSINSKTNQLTNNKSIDKSVVEVKDSLKSFKINDKTEDIYPDDKNPFGDEEEEEEIMDLKTYPSDKNPFGDDDEEEDNESSVQIRINRTDSVLNPFGEETDGNNSNNTPTPKPRKSLAPSEVVSPTSSLRGRKKRPAPTPPAKSLTQVNSSCSLNSSVAISGENSRRDSIISNISSDFGSSVPSVPNSRTPTPLPRLRSTPIQKSSDSLSDFNENKISCDHKLEDNKHNISIKSEESVKSNDSESDAKNVNTFGFWKNKKRPAPPIPAVKRIIKGSIAEIEAELNSIGDKLPIVENKSLELELLLKNRETGDSVDPKDEIMDQFLTNAREKCRLAKRQKELMYMKREHKLEEIQADIEYQMRIVISKQSAQKTEEDQKKEEQLLQRLVEIIEERNDIVENMIRDENKEVEEYHKIVSKVMPTKSLIKSKSETKLTKTEDSVKDTKHRIKDKKKSKKEKSEKSEKSLKLDETKKDAKHSFSLGKSTLKKLGMKSTSDHKLDKMDKKSEKTKSNSVLSAKTDK